MLTRPMTTAAARQRDVVGAEREPDDQVVDAEREAGDQQSSHRLAGARIGGGPVAQGADQRVEHRWRSRAVRRSDRRASPTRWKLGWPIRRPTIGILASNSPNDSAIRQRRRPSTPLSPIAIAAPKLFDSQRYGHEQQREHSQQRRAVSGPASAAGRALGLAVVAAQSRGGEQHEPREDEQADPQTGGLGDRGDRERAEDLADRCDPRGPVRSRRRRCASSPRRASRRSAETSRRSRCRSARCRRRRRPRRGRPAGSADRPGRGSATRRAGARRWPGVPGDWRAAGRRGLRRTGR